MLPLVPASAFVFVWLCAYWCNKDLFSPIKLYLLTLFICFFDIFITPYSLEITCIYLGLALVPLLVVNYEAQIFRGCSEGIRRRSQTRLPIATENRIVMVIWLFTIAPVCSMIYFVSLLGGLSTYLSQLAIRPLAFQGLNTFSELAVNLISLLTVVYFGFGLTQKRSRWWWTCYSLHLATAATILSLSGSRRYLLMPVIMMLALYHYLHSEISVRRAGFSLLAVLFVTSVVGVLRMGQRDATFFARDLSAVERESVTAHFKYGLVPLEVVLDANVLTLHYGSTFLAAITNFIPRPFWPEKPDAAGIVITQDYLGNRWLGTSYLNAGFLAESIMNFGYVVGLTFSFAMLIAAMIFLSRRYRRIAVSLRQPETSIRVVIQLVRYFHIAFAITGLITWETAIVAIPLVLNLSVLFIFEKLISQRTGRREARLAYNYV